MKVIQTINDLELLKATGEVPLVLLKVIERDFIDLYKAEGNDEEIIIFRLPIQQAILTLGPGDDVRVKLGRLIDIDYVEEIEEKGIKYYRITKRFDHEFQLLYSMVGIHDEAIEDWLARIAE